MTLLSTESFMAFARHNGDDTFNPANTAVRNNTAAALRRAGYDVVIGSQANASFSFSWLVRNDPVDPTRAALAFSLETALGQGYAMLRKRIGPVPGPIIGGFSLYVPSEWVKGTADASNSPFFDFVALPANTAISPAVGVPTGGTATEVFRIGGNLKISYGTEAAASSKSITPGRMAYIEYRISDGEIRVWLDDTLVVQKQINVVPEILAILILGQGSVAGSSAMAGLPGRWAISNWYNLIEDAFPPNVRLGPTTRVIGARPDADVAVQFLRPNGTPSNASVVGQDLVDNPINSLQSVTVGDTDVYSTSTDTATGSAALVHAVSTKVLSANLESLPHTIRPLVLSAGTEGEDSRNDIFTQLPAAGLVGTKPLTAIARRPTDGTLFMGAVGNAIYKSPPAGDGTAWAVSMPDEGAIAAFITGIIFRADGTGIAFRQDGKIAVLPAGSDTWQLVTPTGNTAANYSIAGAVAKDGTFVLGGYTGGRCLRSSTPEVAASWVVGTPFNTTWPVNQFAVAPDGTMVAAVSWGTNNPGTPGNYRTWKSTDNGLNWVPGLSAAVQTAVYGRADFQLLYDVYNSRWNFVRVYATATAIAGYMGWYSADAITWVQNTSLMNTILGTAVNTFCAVQNNGYTFAAGSVRTSAGIPRQPMTAVTTDGINWRTQVNAIPETSSGQAFYACCLMSNGSIIMCGEIVTPAAPILMTYGRGTPDWPMLPLAGYQPTFNSAARDPATGQAWTPASAAATRFGMKLTS